MPFVQRPARIATMRQEKKFRHCKIAAQQRSLPSYKHGLLISCVSTYNLLLTSCISAGQVVGAAITGTSTSLCHDHGIAS